VKLNVYGLWESSAAMNRVLSKLGTGAFHCGVEVYGREWSYQPKPDHTTGVFFCKPRHCKAQYSFESIAMGTTRLTDLQVQLLIAELQEEWYGDDYDLLAKNCCHFCQALCEHLGAEDLPPWVTSLSDTGLAVRSVGESAAMSCGDIGTISLRSCGCGLDKLPPARAHWNPMPMAPADCSHAGEEEMRLPERPALGPDDRIFYANGRQPRGFV
jgi:hypothetical protein